MANAALNGFLTRTDACESYDISDRSIGRYLKRAMLKRDEQFLRHFKLATFDDQVIEGTTVDLPLIAQLTDQGRVPTWYVSSEWLQRNFEPRADQRVRDVRIPEQPTNPGESRGDADFTNSRDEVIALLKKQIEALELDKEKLEQEKREMREDARETRNLMNQMQQLMAHMQTRLLPESTERRSRPDTESTLVIPSTETGRKEAGASTVAETSTRQESTKSVTTKRRRPKPRFAPRSPFPRGRCTSVGTLHDRSADFLGGEVMTLHVHVLTGCGTTPLAFYLKAIGVLRLLADQADATVRGWWRDECFHIASSIARDQLIEFFLTQYCPTPLIAPWNGGSGFYPKDNKSGIDPVTRSKAPRFAAYRDAIAAGRLLTKGSKESPKDEAKTALLQACRRTWRGPLLAWLDAAVVLDADGDPAYPALLGTGGNDGRLDFTNNFMQRLTELFDCDDADGVPRPESRPLLEAALFGERQPGLLGSAIGQFYPGSAGGANSTVGFGGGSLVNPWDFVLMLEGAIVFASAVTRRATTQALPLAAAPFAVFASSVGYATGADGEKSRGEQWLPLWERPVTCREMVSLLAEARCQLPSGPATRPVQVARAIARLGVARGISAFERFGYIERNGQSNLAAPLGRWNVPTEPQPFQQLLDDVASWVDSLRRAGTDKNAPAAISRAARKCEDGMMACCRDARSAERWLQLLIELGDAERQLTRSPRFTASKGLQPLGAYGPRLRPDWLFACNDTSPELRLAVALAGQHGMRIDQTSQQRVPDRRDPVRRHFLPLEYPPTGTTFTWFPRRFAASSDSLADDTAVVCVTNDLLRDAIELVHRRVIESRSMSAAAFNLISISGTESSLSDILEFLSGRVDNARVLALARPLMAMDWDAFDRVRGEIREKLHYPSEREDADAAGALALFGLLRLCHHWSPVFDRPVRLDPAIIARLIAGDLPGAVNVAARRLKASGLRPHVTQAAGESWLVGRIAASLAFPINQSAAARLAARLLRPTVEPEPFVPQSA
jgi:CRISPR-associated protein Csx17